MPPQNTPTKKSSFWKELVSYAVFALIIVVPIRLWIAQPFVVNGSSMDTTFANGQYLIVDEISYHLHEPQRGDVLIFKYPLDTTKYFIKRIIGLPGDTVTVNSDKVTITDKQYPNGITLNEPYISSRTFGNQTTTLTADQYFVLGDNRIVSSDSRVWGIVPRSDIVGTPVLRLLPFSKIGIWPGQVGTSTMFAPVSTTPIASTTLNYNL